MSARVGAMLFRNTVVSCSVFGLGLIVLWALVTWGHIDKVVAAGISFIVANTLHYVLGRSWIFHGTDRAMHTGYILFLINSGVGLLVTLGLYALILKFTSMDFVTARILVSLFAGLLVFVLNAVLNFRQV